MKHAREDYNRIQDPSGLIPKNEPVFLLRGQDVTAPTTLRFWADQVESMDGDPEIVRRAREQADSMDRWQEDVVCKRPDLTHGKTSAETFDIMRPTIFRDGNEWCVLCGPDIQEGICGFGKTPGLAMADYIAKTLDLEEEMAK